MKKPQDFFSYISILFITLCLIPSIIGFLLGVFVTSSIDAKYMTALIGAFAGTLALIGVIYSKNKERSLKEIELLYDEKKNYQQQHIQFISYILICIDLAETLLTIKRNIYTLLYNSEDIHPTVIDKMDFSVLFKEYSLYRDKKSENLVTAMSLQNIYVFFQQEELTQKIIQPLYEIDKKISDISIKGYREEADALVIELSTIKSNFEMITKNSNSKK